MTDMTLSIGDIIAIVALLLAGNHFQLKRIETAMNRRFDDAQRANDAAHTGIGENINRLYGLMNAIVPRAAAEPPQNQGEQ